MSRLAESQKDENPLAGGFPSATTKKHEADCDTNHFENKVFAALQARFAINGHTLYKTSKPDGTSLYVSARWGHTKELRTLEEVSMFLAQIGGSK